MDNIKIKLIINSKFIIGKEKIKNKLYLISENYDRIVRNDISNIIIICDVCGSSTNCKNLPENFILEKETYLCKSCRNKGDSNPMFGKKWTDDRRADRSINYKGNNNPMFGKNIYEIWKDKYSKEQTISKIVENRKKHSINNSGENNPMYERTYYDIWFEKYNIDEVENRIKSKSEKHRNWLNNNPQQLDKMIKSTLSRGYKKTSIEKVVEEYLKLKKINYKYNFILSNNQFDFLIPDYNIIIEVHGDYWHANPEIYGEGKKELNERQLFKINRDIEKSNYIKENTNFNILYIWETDIKNEKYKRIIDGIYRN